MSELTITFETDAEFAALVAKSSANHEKRGYLYACSTGQQKGLMAYAHCCDGCVTLQLLETGHEPVILTCATEQETEEKTLDWMRDNSLIITPKVLGKRKRDPVPPLDEFFHYEWWWTVQRHPYATPAQLRKIVLEEWHSMPQEEQMRYASN